MTARAAAPDLGRLRERLRVVEEQKRRTGEELEASREARIGAWAAGASVPDPPGRNLVDELDELDRAVDRLRTQLAAAEEEAAADGERERKEAATAKVAAADQAARELRSWLRSPEMQERLGRVRGLIGEAAAAEHATGTQAGSTRAAQVLFGHGLARVVGELEQFLTHDPAVAEERRRASMRNWPSPQPTYGSYVLLPPGTAGTG